MNEGFEVGYCELLTDDKNLTGVGFLNTISNFKELKVKKLDPRAKLPTKGSIKSAGLDLYVFSDEEGDVVIPPNGCYKFRTGISIQPPTGMYTEVFVRSSVGCKKHLQLMNGTGIIDCDYTGEVLVFVHNFGKEPVKVEQGERLCQMILKEYYNVIVTEVDELDETERGSNGFGSTGR